MKFKGDMKMDKKYTVELVEELRARSGISYEEAVALLDKYDGDIARALVELEKRGVLTGGKKKKEASGTDGFAAWCKRLLALSISTRVKFTKGDVVIANLTVLFLIACTCFAPWLAIASVILIFLLDLRVNVEKNSDLYASATLKSMVDGAAETIKANVDNLTRTTAKEPEKEESPKRPTPAEDSEDTDDYDSITIE